MSASAAAVATIPRSDASARERIERAAYELFSRHGIHAVGVDKIIAKAGIAKMTLYRHFPTKEMLAIAFLRRREEHWTRDWLQREVRRKGKAPRSQLLAIFDVFDRWFRRSDFEGCAFITVLLEIDDRSNPVRRATVHHLAEIRAFLRGLAVRAGIENADNFSRQWHILMKGSIIAAGEGDRDAARHAKDVGALLLARSIPTKRSQRAHTD